MPYELAQLQARYDRLNSLYQVSTVIHSTLEPQEALQLILDEAVRLMRASLRPAKIGAMIPRGYPAPLPLNKTARLGEYNRMIAR